ncbi:autotransporter outer membrane beta-barrel domain-containing protein [Erwinia rhapontici]
MDVDLNKKWNIGKLLKTPMCVVPLIFAPCMPVWAEDTAILVTNNEARLIENEIYSNGSLSKNILAVTNGGDLTANGVTLNSTGARSSGVSVQNGKFNAQDLIVNVSGSGSTGLMLGAGAEVVLKDLNISGDDTAKGLVFKGNSAEINTGTISTNKGTAINASSGVLTLNNVSASTQGTNNYALEVTSEASVSADGGSFSTEEEESSAVWIHGLNPTATLNDVTITTKGDVSMGVKAESGTMVLTNSKIETEGGGSHALYTEDNIRGENLAITTRGEASVALDVQQNAEGVLLKSTVDTYGDSSSAIDAGEGAAITADDVQIKTMGKQSYGISSSGSTLDIRNSDISTAGELASGMYVGGLGAGDSSVSLDTVTIDARQAQAIEFDTASAVMNVKNSVLTGGNGQALTVADNEANNAYSNLTFNATGSTLNGDIVVSHIGNTVAVDLSSASVLNGAVTKATSLSLDASSEWNMNNNSDVGQLTNNGTITFSDQSKFDTLTITGDYAGDGGLLVMNSVLGDDSSQTNKLIVGGDVLAGTTSVTINNLGGQGAQTVEGIEIVEVGGTSTGTFEKSGRMVAGAYDYDLVQKGENWYLTSLLTPVVPDPTDPTNPTDPTDPNPGHTLHPSVIRPEGGSYTANLATANTLFLLTLHDRLGETQFIDALTGQKEVTSMWLRQVGGHNSWHDDSGQLKTQSNRYVAQIGGDVARWSTDGLDRWHVGIMAGYGDSHSTTRNQHSGYRSKGSVNGYSVGGYATWYGNTENHTGAHLDTWLQYGWFDNDVKGEELATESYKSHGVSASLEGGYTWKLGQFSGSQGSLNEWFIQPQAQVVWMGVKANNVQEANGTKVKGEGDGNLLTRLGVKTYLKGHSAIDNNKQREFQPFLQVNWLHNTRNFATKMDDVRVSQNGATNLAEVKVGLEGKVNPRLNLWGNIGVQMGDAGYNDNAAMVGVKYNF